MEKSVLFGSECNVLPLQCQQSDVVRDDRGTCRTQSAFHGVVRRSRDAKFVLERRGSGLEA